jgi:hypothetical protein
VSVSLFPRIFVATEILPSPSPSLFNRSSITVNG